MNLVRKSRRWMYANLLLLVGFAAIGSWARPTLAAPTGGSTSIARCSGDNCDPNGIYCRNCLVEGVICSGPADPPVRGHCAQADYPVGCQCK